MRIHCAFIYQSNFHIIENLACGGDLFSYITNGERLRPIPECEVLLIIFQLLKALDYLHNKLKVIHSDIKLDNILMEIPLPYSRVYLCDFGAAKSLDYNTKNRSGIVGTFEYTAPEIIFQNSDSYNQCDPNNEFFHSCNFFNDCSFNSNDNYKCDMWSLGVTCHILLSGISPFCDDLGNSSIKNYLLNNDNFNFSSFFMVSNEAKDFLKNLLKVNLSERLDVNGCFNHTWINLKKSFLEKVYNDKIIFQ